MNPRHKASAGCRLPREGPEREASGQEEERKLEEEGEEEEAEEELSIHNQLKNAGLKARHKAHHTL